MRCRLATVQLIVVAIACAPESAAISARVPTRAHSLASLAGCYALFDRAGHPAARSLYWAPSFTKLDTSPEGRAWKLDAAMRTELPEDTVMETREWTVDSLADTLRITFHNGFSGSTFVLGVRAGTDTLRGHGIEHWDFGPSETNAGAVSAVRIPCSR